MVIAAFGFFSAVTICNIMEFIPGFQMRCIRAEEILGLDFTEHWVNPGNDIDFNKLSGLHASAEYGALASQFKLFLLRI